MVVRRGALKALKPTDCVFWLGMGEVGKGGWGVAASEFPNLALSHPRYCHTFLGENPGGRNFGKKSQVLREKTKCAEGQFQNILVDL